jgi:hypothetical protein
VKRNQLGPKREKGHCTLPIESNGIIRPAAQKTWANIKTFISAEYAKENKQNKLLAKHFKANSI